MKAGMDLQSLERELLRQDGLKHDYRGRVRELRVHTPSYGPYGVGRTELDMKQEGTFSLTGHAHGQLAEYLSIPKPYYNRMAREHPTLFDQSVNTWLGSYPEDRRGREAQRMVRTMDGHVRALLSMSYFRLEHLDLVDFIVPVLAETPNLRIVSASVTERVLYIKATVPSIALSVKEGSTVGIGIVVRNSEVGVGLIAVLPYITIFERGAGLIVDHYGRKRHHVRRRLDLDDEDAVVEMYSDEALAAEKRSFFLKVRDTAQSILTGKTLELIVEDMRRAVGIKISHPEAAITELSRMSAWTEGERESVFRNLIEGADLSLFGLAQAVSRASDSLPDYDRASAFEVLAGRLVTLDRGEWRDVVDARPQKKGRADDGSGSPTDELREFATAYLA